MKHNFFNFCVGGMLLLGTSIVLSNNSVSAATVMTPDQMKSQLTEQDIKEATPTGSKETDSDGKATDDIGMPTETKPSAFSREITRSYPNVNNYILQQNYQHPNITQELHTFSMFGYKTDDGLPAGVAVHYTDNPNNFSARSEADYEINGGWQSAFVHTFIDAGSILNIHDTNYGAWGSGAVGNKYFTQFEMVTARNFEDFAKTTSYSAWYTAYLLHQYNLTPSLAQSNNGVGTVWSHSNISHYLGGTDHTDPDAYFAKYGYDMNQFFGLVQHYYGQMNRNVASLDNFTVSGKTLQLGGWHAANDLDSRPYSYIFLMDADTNQELQRFQISRTRRNDVQNAYPDIQNAANSGFIENLPISDAIRGHKVRIISRYTNDPRGNGNAIDYAFHKTVSVPQLKTSEASFDSFVNTQDGNMHIRGWFADNNSVGKPYRYLIMMNANTNQEIKRYKMTTISRPDVGNVYPEINNSVQSGFLTSIPLTSDVLGKNVKFIARYSDDPNGNGNYTDHWFNENVIKVKDGDNRASLDNFDLTSNTLYVHGWHATDFSIDKPYSYIIVLDAKNNGELGRFAFKRQIRNDVQSAYPNISNAANSGFNFMIPLTSNMHGKTLRILSRYTDDPRGNGNSIDYFFTNNSIKVK